LTNVAVCQAKEPPAPPEVSTWVNEPTPPDLLDWARQTLDEVEILTDIGEVKRTGGLQLSNFIGEIEERIGPAE
jgi:hypothetical protein